MTEEEYLAMRKRIEANITDFKKNLWRAQAVFNRECDALRELDRVWKAQQRG